MKAAQLEQYGGIEELKTVSDAPVPSINPDQVLVEVAVAGVNPFDWKIREGIVRQMAELHFPAILGGDFAGTVTKLGANVEHLSIGDAVYGFAGALSSHGSYAEYVPASASAVGPKPVSVDFIQAGALPLVGISAYQAMVEVLKVTKGQKVLIHGGAGGIGSIAIQIGKHLGAYVATTADSSHNEYLKRLGADKIIDYKSEKFQDMLSDYDAVFDNVGGQTFLDSFSILRSGGAIVTMNSAASDELADKYNVHVYSLYTQVTTDRLAKLAGLVDEGIVSIAIDKIFSLERAGEALGYLQNDSHEGKVVIRVKN